VNCSWGKFESWIVTRKLDRFHKFVTFFSLLKRSEHWITFRLSLGMCDDDVIKILKCLQLTPFLGPIHTQYFCTQYRDKKNKKRKEKLFIQYFFSCVNWKYLFLDKYAYWNLVTPNSTRGKEGVNQSVTWHFSPFYWTVFGKNRPKKCLVLFECPLSVQKLYIFFLFCIIFSEKLFWGGTYPTMYWIHFWITQNSSLNYIKKHPVSNCFWNISPNFLRK
jgi:hypothetical protein